MKKIKLLITSAALLVGGGLLASSSNNIIKANAADIDLTNCQYEKIDSVEALSDGNYIFGYDVNFDENTSSIKSGNFLGSFGENIFQRTTELNGAEIINIKKDSSNGYYTLQIGEQYVEYHGSSNNVYLKNDGNIYWTPILKDGSFHFQNIEKDSNGKDRFLEYNKSSGQERFACYKGTQESFDLFKIIENNKYSVTLMDGDEIINTIEVDEGKLVDLKDENPIKEGFVFEGWYIDSEFTTPFDVNTLVTEDLVLYAKYILISDLSIGEQFALQTTKKSLIANVSETKSIITKNLTSSFTFNPNKNKLSTIGFDSKWSYDAKHNGSGTYPQISNGDLKLFTNKGNHSSLTMSYDGIINSISFKDISNLSKIEIRDEKGDIVSHLNGTYSFSDNNHSFTIYNSSDTNTTINNSFSIEYIDNVLEVTNSSIRFGTALSSKLYDEKATYGVIFGLNGEDINTLAENETSVENLLINNKTLHSAQASNIAMVDTDTGAVEESKNPETAPYFQYAIVIKDMLEHIGEEITAACYMETNDNLYVMNEVTYSVKTLSNEYLNNIEEGTLSEDYKDILNAILNYNA